MANHLQKLPHALLPDLRWYRDSDSALAHLLWHHSPEHAEAIFHHFGYR